DLAVFNPSPHPRTDVVRFAPVPRSWIELGVGNEVSVHPWLQIGLTAEGYTVDGQPARLVADEGTDRIRLLADVPARTIEFVAAAVPAFGWRRFRLAPSGRHPDLEDEAREISCDAIGVAAGEDGTLAVRLGDRTYNGLAGLEDVGDRGDAYDFDPVREGEATLAEVRVRRDASRWVHPAPSTFPHQGFVAANGLTVAAPGLPEAEVTPDGIIAVTLVRAVGWLARMDLRSRPRPAGPLMPAPGAQCLGT